jgi:transposase-like protein
VLKELSVAERRYRAVLEVLHERVPVVEVTARYGVTRQSVHNWVRRYFDAGPDEGLLHDVLGVVQVAGDREQLPDQAAVAGVVEHVETVLARQAHRSSSVRT